MQHIRALDLELPPSPLGEGYSGPETYRDAPAFESRDGTTALGVWSYDGRLVSTNPGRRHQIWVVLRGRITVEIGAQQATAARGDVIVFEAPYEPKTVEASEDFRAVWIACGAPPSATAGGPSDVTPG